MPFEFDTLLLITAISFIAYVLFALSGFGSNLVTVPLLGHFLALTFVLPTLAILDFFAAARIGFQSRGHLLKGEIVRLLPSLGLGIVAGTTLLVNLPPAITLGTLGAFIFCYGIYSFKERPLRFRLAQWMGYFGVEASRIQAIRDWLGGQPKRGKKARRRGGSSVE